MFCAKCGAVLADDARKCDKCGAPVRIRPNQPDKKGRGGKSAFSVPDESDLPSREAVENSLQQDLFMDPVFFQEADENLDVDTIIKIARGEDPGIIEHAPEPEPEPEPELDMETYLQSLPLIEKIRRRLQARHHAREEAADDKRMKKHLERASKHFSEAENAAIHAEEMRLEEAARRKREKARAEAERVRMQQQEAARRQEEKLLAEKAEAERAEAEREAFRKAEAEKAEAEREEFRKAEAERAEAEKEEFRRAEAEKAEAAARLQKEQEQTESTDHQEREGLEVIRLQKAAVTREDQRTADERAAEEALQREAMLAEQAALRREEAKRAEAQHAQAEKTIRLQEEKASVQKNLHGVLHDPDSFKTFDVHGRKELTAAEREMEVLRRKRKYRSNQPDRFDEYLGRYGLTKEIAVRIATLFLIVLLSVIYAMGRGSKNTASAPAPANAGSAATGFDAAEEQPDDETGAVPSQDAGETEVPTGGGDFENN